MKNPSIFILLGISIGVLTNYYVELNLGVLYFLFFLLVLLFFIINYTKINLFITEISYISSFFIFFFLVFIGVFISKINTANIQNLNNKNIIIQGVISSFPNKKIKTTSFELKINKIISLKKEAKWYRGKIFVTVFSKKNVFDYGDKIILKAKLNHIKNRGNPGEFDFKKYLNKKGINYSTFVTSDDIKLIEKNVFNVLKKILNIRSYFLKQIDYYFSKQTAPVAKAILLGYKNDLTEDTRADYAGSGASHVLAVSGMHVGIVVVFLNFILLKWIKNKKTEKIARIVTIFIIFCYVIITGFSPSILRAGLMFSLIVFGGVLRKDTNALNHVATSAIILLIYNPFYLFDLGFQLSYLAVFSILILYKKFYNLLFFKSKIVDNLWKLTCVSLSAQIGTFPLVIFYFHQFPTLFLLINPIITFFAFIILLSGIFFMFFIFNDLFSNLFSYCCETTITLLNNFTGWINSITYSKISGIYIEFWHILVLFLVIIVGVFVNLKKKNNLFVYVFFIVAIMSLVFSISSFNKNRIDRLIVFNSRKGLVVNFYYNDKSAYYISKNENSRYGLTILNSYWESINSRNNLKIDTSVIDNSFFWYKQGVFLFDKSKLLFLTNENKFLLHSVKFNYVIFQEYINNLDIGKGSENWIIPRFILKKESNQLTSVLKQKKQKIYNIKKEGVFRIN